MAITATVTNAGLNLVRSALNNGGSIKASYVAIGTGTQGTPATATKLASEVFRKAITSVANGAAAGEGLINMYLSPQDSVGSAITEVGLFIGGTSAKDSGTLVFYATYSHTHTNAESIQFQFSSVM